MSQLKDRLRSSTSSSSVMATDTNEASLTASFLLHLSEALGDNDIVKKFQTIMSPLMTPVMDALNQANATIDSLKKRMDEKTARSLLLSQTYGIWRYDWMT